MPYVKRGSDGKILSISSENDADHPDFLDGLNDEILEFLGKDIHSEGQGKSDDRMQELIQSDLDLIRVIEDLIGVLLAKGVFRFDELPVQAQRKLTSRSSLRRSLSNPIDFSLDDSGDGLI